MSESSGVGEYLTLGEACRLVGITRPTLRERIKSGVLVSYDDPRDKRRVLVSARDLRTLNTPRLRRRAGVSPPKAPTTDTRATNPRQDQS